MMKFRDFHEAKSRNSFDVYVFLYLSQVMWSGKLAQKRPENSPGKLQGQTLRFFVKLLYWGNDKPVSTKHIWQSKNNIAKMLSIPLRVVNSIL